MPASLPLSGLTVIAIEQAVAAPIVAGAPRRYGAVPDPGQHRPFDDDVEEQSA